MKPTNIDLRCGDCLELMKGITDESVDMILTDPPYGMDYQSHRRKEVYARMEGDKSLEWLSKYFSECFRMLKDNTAIYCFCSWHNIDNFKEAFEKYFKIKNVIVWVKNNHGSGDLRAGYAPRYEFILYGNKGRRCFSGKRMDDVFFFNKTRNQNHPTEKPVDLLETLINNSSDENAIVFDGFMGSGSTGVACINTGRYFIGIELDESYFNIAKNRIEKAAEERENNEHLL